MATGLQQPRHIAPPSALQLDDELPTFRFGLRQLFAFVTFVSVLMTGMVLAGGLTALALLLAMLVVLFHVFSTALGSQLRTHSHQLQGELRTHHGADRLTHSLGPAINAKQQPRSPWHERRSTPLPWRTQLIAVAAICGGVVGAILLNATVAHRSSTAGIAVGSLSTAVVAGWFAFLGYSFYGVFRHGLRQAMDDERRREQPP
jgi:hypothetical protein